MGTLANIIITNHKKPVNALEQVLPKCFKMISASETKYSWYRDYGKLFKLALLIYACNMGVLEFS